MGLEGEGGGREEGRTCSISLFPLVLPGRKRRKKAAGLSFWSERGRKFHTWASDRAVRSFQVPHAWCLYALSYAVSLVQTSHTQMEGREKEHGLGGRGKRHLQEGREGMKKAESSPTTRQVGGAGGRNI